MSSRAAGLKQPLRFQGQYYDHETGLHYNRHRYYDPHSGRFVSKDPIGLIGGLHSHNYVRSPVQFIDPSGLTEWTTRGPFIYMEATLPSTYSFEYIRSIDETEVFDPNIRKNTNSPRTDNLPWGDGCGAKDSDHLVPDKIAIVLGRKAYDFHGRNVGGTYKFNLLNSCRTHDVCYGNAKTGAMGRDQCDMQLGDNTRRACDGSGAPMEVCNAIGHAYYLGVHLGGEKAWIDAGGKADK